MICSVDGCARPVRARGWCTTHWARWKRTGSHLTVRPRYPQRELSDRIAERSRVDSETGCLIWTGALTAAGYGEMHLDGAVVLVHRAVYASANGSIGVGIDIHHVCEHRSCCNLDHLEPISHASHAAHHHRGKTKRKAVA